MSTNIDLTVTFPQLGTDASGRITAHCPDIPESDAYNCWTLENPDEKATHDFWLQTLVVKAGDISMLSMVTPLEDGGLQHFVQMGEFRDYTENTFISTIKQSHGSVGVVSLQKLEAKTYYHELQRIFARTKFRVGNFDADGEPVGEYVEVIAFKFPPLPRSSLDTFGAEGVAATRLPPETAIRLMDPADFDDGRAIYFPTFEEEGDDFVVDDGDEVQPAPTGFVSIGADLDAPRPPGIHAEFASHPGDPAHVVTVFWFQPRRSAAIPKPLFGDSCTQLSFREMEEHVFVKKKKSWFRTKTKITTVRKELRLSELLCQPIPLRGRPPSR